MFNIVLAEDTEFLDETIVIGYGVQRKSDLTGAVASVRSEDLENRSVTAAAALQGKTSGVYPGRVLFIKIRKIVQAVSKNGHGRSDPVRID